MFRKLLKKWRNYRMSMGLKLTIALGSIAVMLLVSSIISVMEYRRMSNYVSEQVASNIKSINVAQKMASMADDYNLQVLATIGDEEKWDVPDFDTEAFMALCDSLRSSFALVEVAPIADSVLSAFALYRETSMELPEVLLSDFIDSRDWFFFKLQPYYNRLQSDIEMFSDAAYRELKENSLTFQDSFYRSIVPGIVSVGAGLVLVFLLLFFTLVFYVRPIYRMLDGLENYLKMGARYKLIFDGQDQLAKLNSDITEIVEENIELKKRNKALREERDRMIETIESIPE